MFSKKTLLISGGTGSFGHTVLKRFLNTDIGEIRIFSRDEKKQQDMRDSFNNNNKLKFYIGDVRDPSSIVDAINGVHYVFHAAALKQVPSCEFYPMESVKTNVIGTDNILNAAIQAGVEKVICLSTDKAVYPINAMGISKAMMEKIMVAKSRIVDTNRMVICGTRYGNVMASRGSVIPLFTQQIKNGQPITLTDPNMTRYLMNLNEAVELVLFAFEYGTPGDIFVQKSPACTIQTLADAVKAVFNRPNHPVNIIGTRHSEKLFETLLTREESASAEDLGEYFRIPADNRDLNYGKYFTNGQEISARIEDYNSHNTTRFTLEQVVDKLHKLDYIQEELQGWDTLA